MQSHVKKLLEVLFPQVKVYQGEPFYDRSRGEIRLSAVKVNGFMFHFAETVIRNGHVNEDASHAERNDIWTICCWAQLKLAAQDYTDYCPRSFLEEIVAVGNNIPWVSTSEFLTRKMH